MTGTPAAPAARAAYEAFYSSFPGGYLEWEDLRDRLVRAAWGAAGQAAADTERESIAARIGEMAANYPESVFPPGSGSRDAISGTAMRHAYQTAARLIRQLDSLGDGEEPYPPPDEIVSLDTDVMED